MQMAVVGTFLQLWVLSFEMYTKDEKNNIFSNLGMAISLTTLVLFWPTGKLADYLPSKISIPCSLLLISIIMASFYYINDPNQFLSYFLWCITSWIFMFERVSMASFFTKNVPKEVRGTMVGFFAFFGGIGNVIAF